MRIGSQIKICDNRLDHKIPAFVEEDEKSPGKIYLIVQ